MRHSHSIKIYKKRWHLTVTFLVIILPFVFILAFSKITGVEARQVFIDLGASFVRILAAYVLSIILAMVSVIFLEHGKIGNFFLPVLDVLQSFPSFALLPILTIWFGIGNTAAIFFLVVTMIWPILFSVLSSIRTARADLKEAAEVFGARGIKKFLYFTTPVSFPGLIVGSVVGLGEGWEAIVGAEIIGVTPGIGGFLNAASVKGDIPVLAFGILALLIFLFSLNKIVWLPLLKRSHDYSHE
jgi:ABC-type nitrate/sulfonate/bicarbonate transport system permease component